MYVQPMMMRASALLVAIAAAVAFTAPSLLAQNDADRKDWTQLFNGTNLDGWTVKITGHEPGDNFGDTFRVQDGKLAVSYDKYRCVRRPVRPHLLPRHVVVLPHRCRVPVRR